MHPPHLTANFASSMCSSMPTVQELDGKVSQLRDLKRKDAWLGWRLDALDAIGAQNELTQAAFLSEQDLQEAHDMITELIKRKSGEPRVSQYPSASSLASPCMPATPRGGGSHESLGASKGMTC